MPLFRKKPVVIEANQWFKPGDHPEVKSLREYAEAYELLAPHCYPADVYVIPTLEGHHDVTPGDWIIKGVVGEFYPCKPDVFEATYEPV
jgi:hypothetical protein